MNNYHSLAAISITVVIYAITYLLAKLNILSPANLRKIWNSALLIFFLASAVLGLILAVSLDNQIVITWYSRVLWWHVEAGLAMTVVGIIHFLAHLNYYWLMAKSIRIKNTPNAYQIKKVSKFFLVLISFLTLNLLTGCTVDNNKNVNQTSDDKKTKIQSPTNAQADTLVVAAPTNGGNDALEVTSACIGCGRCINTDPAHFTFDNSRRQSTVIFQDNLDSAALGRAVSNCPANAIVRT